MPGYRGRPEERTEEEGGEEKVKLNKSGRIDSAAFLLSNNPNNFLFLQS
jgi:hypothetical protein